MSYIVSSGQISSGISLASDEMTVLRGGLASCTTLENQGDLHVCSGGTAENVTIHACGDLHLDGGSATDVTIYQDGFMHVSSGASADSVTIYNGTLQIGEGSVNNVMIGWGDVFITSGGTATDVINEGYLQISGGTAEKVTLYGQTDILDGGIIHEVQVKYYGDLKVSEGGIATSVTVDEGGTVHIYSGGSVSMDFSPWANVQVHDGGILTYASAPEKIEKVYYGNGESGIISCGDSLSGLDIQYGQYAIVRSGGALTDTAVSGTARLYSGGTAANMAVTGGFMHVDEGGTVSDVTISDWGNLFVGFKNNKGGYASGVTIDEGGYLEIYSGGTATDINVISSGGIFFYGNGASATDITAAEDTKLVIYTTPDSYIQGTIGGEAFEFRDGIVNDFTVRSNMSLYLQDGAASNVILESGGSFSCDGTTVAAGILLKPGATMNDLTYWGDEDVLIREFEQSELRGAVISGGSAYWGGQCIKIGDSAALVDVKIYGGEITVKAGGAISSASLIYTGELTEMRINSGASVSHLRIGSGGDLYVDEGGTAEMLQCASGCSVYVASGASAQVKYDLWTSGYPEIDVADGGIVTYVPDAAKVYCGNAFSGTISSGDILTGLELRYGVSAVACSGGILENTIIGNGGAVVVSSGGTANVVTVKWYGSMYVSESGIASGVTISSGGSMYVAAGGFADVCLAGGSMHVCSGASARLVLDPQTKCEPVIDVEDGGIVTYEESAKVCYGNTASGVVSSANSLSGLDVGENEYVIVRSGGSLTDTTVSEYGVIRVSNGGSASNISVNSHGHLNLEGGTVNNVTADMGGNMFVCADGTATGSDRQFTCVPGYLQRRNGK